jgi:hypothetical protein
VPTPYANVEIVGRLAGIPILDGNGKRLKRDKEDGSGTYYATLPQAVKHLTAKDGREFFSFTVVVDTSKGSDWIQCVCYDRNILGEEFTRGQLVCVRGQLSVRDKKDAKTDLYRTNVKVLVKEVIQLVETVPFKKVGTDEFHGTAY